MSRKPPNPYVVSQAWMRGLGWFYFIGFWMGQLWEFNLRALPPSFSSLGLRSSSESFRGACRRAAI
jgi:hypothetical protein